MVTTPALLKAPAVAMFLPFRMVKRPVAAFTAKLASASVPLSYRLRIAFDPSRTIVAAFVTMLALARLMVPRLPTEPYTIYVPPVRVVPLKLVKPSVTCSVLPALTCSVPVLVTPFEPGSITSGVG